MTHELIALGPRGIAAEIRARRMSAREVAQAFLSRVDEAAELNAVAFVDADSVLRMADSADDRASAGDDAPLLGVPFTVKDSIAVRDWPWRSGSFAREHVIAEDDATAVARLRALGAIPLCKTTTPEYTWSAQTSSALHGYTNNPYDLARSAGGSSGGEAALHAVGAAPFGLGTDGLNSIRVPAHFCGTAGLRPTAGIVSEAGSWPLTRTTGLLDISTTGPMAPHARALADVLLAIAGADPADPFAHAFAPTDLPPTSARGLRVGVLPEHAVGPVSPGTRTALIEAASALAAAGATVIEVAPWRTDDAVDLAFRLMAPDGGARARASLAAAGGRHSEEFAGLLDSLGARRLTIEEYLSAVQEWSDRRRAVRESLQAATVTLAPVASGPAPLHDRLPGADEEASSVEAFNHSFVIAMAGVPSAVVPIAMEGHLPVGIQIIGSPHADLSVAAVAVLLQDHFATSIPEPTAWKQPKEAL